LGSAHEKAVASQSAQPWETVADTVRNLGSRLELAEATFPVNDLLPMLKRYAFEHQRGVGPDTWVVDLFLDLGVPYEQVFGILQNMLNTDEVPFSGRNREYLTGDLIYVAQKWLYGTRAGDPFGNDANAGEVLSTLDFVQGNGILNRERAELCQELRAKINQLLR
jgi:nuclear pore complex protein Nup155